MTFSLPLSIWPLFLRPAPAEMALATGKSPPALHADIGLPPPQDSLPADAVAMAAVLRDRGYGL